MSDNGDDDIKFRDRVAIEAMSAFIKTHKITNFDNAEPTNEGLLDRLDGIAELSYMMADAMRKARLGAFE